MQLFNLKFNEETGIPAVHEYISIDWNLLVCLSYHGLVIPLRNGFDMDITVPEQNFVCFIFFSPIFGIKTRN